MTTEFKIPEMDSPKNYPEDYADGHNMYTCRCHECREAFFGYKRRVFCKECFSAKESVVSPKEVYVIPSKFYVVSRNQEEGWEQLTTILDNYESAKSYRDSDFCKSKWPNAFIICTIIE